MARFELRYMLSRFHPIPERYGPTGRIAIFAISISRVSVLTGDNKKLSYRREAARCRVLLSILVSR